MSSPEPAPPPAPSTDGTHRPQTLLRPPGEARGSRTSSIVFSVLLHLALILVIRQLVWVPAVKRDMPVFQVFDLTAIPKNAPVAIAAPHIESEPPPTVSSPPEQTPVARPDEYRAPPAADVPRLVTPGAVPSEIPPAGDPVAVPDGLAPGAAGQGRGSVAERLQPRVVDPAIWSGNRGALPMAPTREELAERRLATGIRAYNDSVAAAIGAAQRATDWTVKGKDGDRWGVSPGQIHLGGITLPLPFGFSAPPGRRDEIAAKSRGWAEGNAQAKRLEMEETFDSRVKAMRARKDAARDSARAARGGG